MCAMSGDRGYTSTVSYASGMLSALQRRVRRIISETPEAENVALAGGGALVVRGVVTRPTADLDYFATSSDEVDRLLATLESRLESGGLSVSRVQVYPGFARLAVSDGYETTQVDLAWDRRLWPPEQKAGGAVLSEEELAADKLLALADRGEARDYIDVAALADRFGFSRLYDLARRKHPKLYPGQLLYSMREFDSLSRGEFDLDDCEWQRLGTLISAWRVSLRQLSAEHDQPDPTRFPELGW